MKNYVFILLSLLVSLNLYSQKDLGYVYLFENFQEGSAVYRTGSKSKSLFNYELISGKIHFKENNTILEIAYPAIIKYITIGDQTFEYINENEFYEKIDLGDIDLYIKHKAALISKGKNAGYGGRSQTTAIDNINQISSTGGFIYKLNVDEDFNIKDENKYFLKINGKFKRFNSVNSLAKLFKNDENKIKTDLSKENLNFNKLDDIKKAVKYCEQFIPHQ